MTTTTDAGRVGEAMILAKLTMLGWYPYIDVSGKSPIDIIAWKDGDIRTFQVKATGYSPNKKPVVQIGSIRPNRTGNTIKKFDPSKVDYLAVYVSTTETVYFIPSSKVVSGRSLTIQETHRGIVPV